MSELVAAIAADFWLHSCAFYGQRGVEQCLLRLQDEQGANINALLLGLYLEVYGIHAQAIERAAKENKHCVKLSEKIAEFRQIRRQIAKVKFSRPDFYQLACRLEIAAERTHQQLLVAALSECGHWQYWLPLGKQVENGLKSAPNRTFSDNSMLLMQTLNRHWRLYLYRLINKETDHD